MYFIYIHLGALCDAQVYIKSQWRDVLSTLPTLTQKLLRKLEDEKDYDNPMYKVYICIFEYLSIYVYVNVEV
jgi:hypothetical protein